jgi:predicted transcriptional regulator of viral defense system
VLRPTGGLPAQSLLDDLPPTFSYRDARRHGISDRGLYALRDQGVIVTIGRGLYRRANDPNTVDLDLIEVVYRAPQATLCLVSALARHDLTDLIPASIDIALPRGQRRPRVAAPVTWHAFAPVTFDIDRNQLRLDEQASISIYGPARCILDAFRLRHHEGGELAINALRRWLSRPGSQPATLLQMAHHFPHAEPSVRAALEILL